MDGRRYLLTSTEFDVLWEDLRRTGPNPGPPPAVLRLNSPGRTHDDRRRVRAAAWRALRDRGLAEAAVPDAELAGLLRTLAHPVRQLELRAYAAGRLGNGPVRAVAAGRDRVGALAVRAADTVLVTGCDSLPLGVLAALPPGPAGADPRCTVPTAALTAAAATAPSAAFSALVEALMASGVPAGEARRLERLLGAVERRAQLVALVKDAPAGVLRRRGGVIHLLDGPRGRYLVTRCTAADRADWTTIAPGHPRHLHRLLAGLLHEGDNSVVRP